MRRGESRGEFVNFPCHQRLARAGAHGVEDVDEFIRVTGEGDVPPHQRAVKRAGQPGGEGETEGDVTLFEQGRVLLRRGAGGGGRLLVGAHLRNHLLQVQISVIDKMVAVNGHLKGHQRNPKLLLERGAQITTTVGDDLIIHRLNSLVKPFNNNQYS